MSNQPLVQSGQAAGPQSEAEYNAVYAAVTATERGRWFLAEFADRNRCADTDRVMAAIARIESAIRAGAASQPSTTPSLTATRDLAAAAAQIVPARADIGERDDDDAPRAPPPSGSADIQAQNDLEARNDLQPPKQTAEAQKDRDYSEAVAAIAASLTARFAESAARAAEDLPRGPDTIEAAISESLPAEAAPAKAMPAKAMPADAVLPQQRVAQDNAPRWHIEAPDFVFGESDGVDRSTSAEPAGETVLAQSQLLGAAILAQEYGEAPGSAEQPASAAIEPVTEPAVEPAVEPTPGLKPVAVPEMPVAATPVPRFPPPAEIVPLPELSRPQLRIANDSSSVNQQPRRYDLLTVTDALSEDEVIALFG